MAGKPRPPIVTKIHQQSNRVLEMLEKNKDGLTSLEITTILRDRKRSDLLFRLQKEGKIKQKKTMLSSGKIGFVYVLNASKQSEF